MICLLTSVTVGGVSYPANMMADCWTEALGVRVFEGLLPGDACGFYDHEYHAIYIDSTLSPIQRNSTLMHELGHAFYRHAGSKPRWEREASIWAARQLVDEDEFVSAMRLFEGSVAVANELGVLPRDIDFYVQWRGKNAADIVSTVSGSDGHVTD